LTYLKVKPNVTFCLCWRSSGAEQLPCKQWVGGSNPPASASFFEELPGAAGGFGEVPKWPKGADCKSAGVRLRGFKSSPPHHCSGCLEGGFDRGWAEKGAAARGTRGLRVACSGAAARAGKVHLAPHLRQAHVVPLSGGNSSAVERQPSKLGVAGSNPVSRSRSRAGAHVAQSAERVLGKDEVSGSIPDMGSRIHRRASTRGARAPRQAARTRLSDIATANGRA
jgi:hypothetical protein